MAIAAADLLAPNGELEVDWFAPLDSAAVTARLTAWIADGYTKQPSSADQQVKDDTAKAWGYYSAYKHIASALARKPSVLTVVEQNDTTSRTYTRDEIQHFTDMSQSWYSVVIALTPVIDTSDFTPSKSVRHRTAF